MTPMVSAKEAIDLVRSLAEASYDELPYRAFSAQLLIAKIDAEKKHQEDLRIARYKQAAINGFHDNELDFDDTEWIIVSDSEEGAYVSCWVWVSRENAKCSRREDIQRLLEDIRHVCDDDCRSNGCKEGR